MTSADWVNLSETSGEDRRASSPTTPLAANWDTAGTGACSAPFKPFSTGASSLGPVLRTTEGQEGAILCTEEESLCGASRQSSLADCGITVLDTPRTAEEYDDCAAVRDMTVLSHPITQSDMPAADPANLPATDGNSSEAEDEQEIDAASEDEFSEVGEPAETEVVYVKEGVAVWPAKNERIMGRLSLIKQHRVMFLAWLPYSQGCLLEDGTFLQPAEAERSATQTARDRTMYAVHPIPLSEVKAIRKHTPSFGWQFIVIVLGTGLTLPPLYFSNGGVRALVSSLKQHAFLVKSADDPNTYLVNDTADPLQRSLTSLELTDVLLGAPPPGASSTFAPAPGPGAQAWQEGDGAVHTQLVASVMEQFQRVTQLARDTTSSLFATALPSPFDRPDEAAGGLRGPAARPGALQPGPLQSALASPSLPSPASEAGSSGQAGLQARSRSGEEASTSVGVFELIDRQGADVVSASRRRVRPPPVSREEWGSFLDAEGRLMDEKGFRGRVFFSGIEPGLRREAWKHLLGVYPPRATAGERAELVRQQQREYEDLRRQWQTIKPAQAARFAKWRERKSRVEKDVRRTDRAQPFYAAPHSPNLKMLKNILLTYSMYNFDLGYCQGMSDLASPILAVVQSEAEAFWCFAALMERMESNFHIDCTGMHAQLLALRKLMQLLDPALHAHLEAQDALNYFFCYRWLLIHFKREFAFDDVLRFWEALWSRHLSNHFHIYVCAAVLEHHRRSIIEQDLDFDSLLKYCIELSGRIDLDAILRDAEILCEYAGDAGKDCLAGLP